MNEVPLVGQACQLIDLVFDDEERFNVLDLYASGASFLELLDLTCTMAARRNLSCEDMDPNAVPEISRIEDLDALRSYVECAANSVHRQAGAIVVPNLPRTLIEGLKRSGFEGQYPGLKGLVLDTVIGIETALREFSDAADQVRSILARVAGSLESVKLAADKIGFQKRLVQLRTMRNVVASAAHAVSGAASSGGAGLTSLATIPIDWEMGKLEQAILEVSAEDLLHQSMNSIYKALDELRQTLRTVGDAYSRIQTGLADLDDAQRKATRYLADIHFLDNDATGSARAVNTVMRRRQNTLRARYEKAALRARRLAYIARRAIEFRLGVDLDQLYHEMTLVPPPSSWADRICTMQGFDYEKLRDPDSDLYSPDEPLWDVDLEYQDQDDYRYWYIGDYVTLLRDFVESYNIDFPFTDESDVAVISVRDDYLKVRQLCRQESRNLLYYTGTPGAGHPIFDENDQLLTYRGWKREGCVLEVSGTDEYKDRCLDVETSDPVSAVQCDVDFCFGEDPAVYAADPDGWPGKATRLRDRPFSEAAGRPDVLPSEDPENGGYLSQVVEAVAPGDYVLTWWNRLPVDAAETVDYRVEVWEVGSETALNGAEHTPDTSFQRRELRFSLGTVADLEVRFYPSAGSDNPRNTSTARFGDVWLWGTQLERLDPWRCRNLSTDECSALPALAYEEVGRDRLLYKPVCADHDGSKMRQHFHRECVCPDREGGVCPEEGGGDSRQCYWYLPLELPLAQLESGALIPSSNIAARNINYRIDEVAVNLVGTNVRTCEGSQTPGTCAANAFIPYTLAHFGKADVSAYEGGMTFNLPVARIEHGKALAAEVVVTNPLTSNHSQLLGSYFKSGLRGRPLSGSYMLRIWETPELDWRRVEDIQLVLRYRYWTRADRAN